MNPQAMAPAVVPIGIIAGILLDAGPELLAVAGAVCTLAYAFVAIRDSIKEVKQ